MACRMKQLSLGEGFRIAHVAEIDAINGEFRAHRFPMEVVAGFENSDMQRVARMSTGVEIQVQGKVEKLRISLRVLDSDGFGDIAELRLGYFCLLPRWKLLNDSNLIQTQEFDIPKYAKRSSVFRLILPTHCTIQIAAVEVDQDAEILKMAEDWSYTSGIDKPVRWLVHGDSITQGANVSTPGNTWVEICARAMKWDPINLGIGGFGCMEPEICDYLASLSGTVDVLSLHVGTNCINARENLSVFTQNARHFVKTLLEAHEQIPLFLASPVYRNVEFNEDQQIVQSYRDAMRNVYEEFAEEYSNFHFIDGLSLLNGEEGIMADMLHIDDEGAYRYAQNLVEILRKQMQ